MPDYTAPTISGIVYSFTTGGYDAPTMSGVPFRFGLRPSYQQTAELQGVIDVMGKYCDSTYTYEKDKQTYVVGYGSAGVQILKGRTIYGGIRDLCTSVYGNPHHADLGAWIRAVSGQADLGGFIRPTIQDYKDLGAFGGGHLPGELPGFIRPTIQDIKDLGGIIDGTFFHGDKDLGGNVYGIPPKDLQGILNVIEIRDLPALINGIYFKGEKDLGGDIFRIWQHNQKDLGAYIYAPIDLQGIINAVYLKDLQAIIQGSITEDLGGEINPVPPTDLPGLIHGWATKDLGAILNGVYGPYDIQAYINTIPPCNIGL